MLSGLDDPEILAGRIGAVVVLILIARLLWWAYKNGLRDFVSIGCGASLACFAWFLGWLLTGGDLPFGLPALGGSVALLVLTLSAGSIRRS